MDPKATDQISPISGGTSCKGPRRRHLNGQRNRNSSFDRSNNWTPFRAAEKKYMVKRPPPDLSEVLDLALLDESRREEIERSGWKGRADAIETREIGLRPRKGKGQRRAFGVPQIPGLVILPSYLTQEEQRRLVRWSLAEHSRKPNETNLDAHYTIPPEGIWNLHVRADGRIISPRLEQKEDSTGPQDSSSSALSGHQMELETSSRPETPSIQVASQKSVTASVLLPRLRWANMGWFYNWSTKQYEFDRGKPDIGEPVRSFCKEIVGSIDWKVVFGDASRMLDYGQDTDPENSDWENWDFDYEPDAGIVNFYQYKNTLMGHVDRSEVCATSPLVSLSLGNAAVFLIGGLATDTKPVAILLRSGDAVVMAGLQCRRVYHGVPRILEGTTPAHFAETAEAGDDWVAFSWYLQTARININVRQMFPKGFDAP